MEQTGCPNLESVRAVLDNCHGIADAAIEELSVQYALADGNWDQAVANCLAAATGTGLNADNSHTATAPSFGFGNATMNLSGEDQVLYLKTIENGQSVGRVIWVSVFDIA